MLDLLTCSVVDIYLICKFLVEGGDEMGIVELVMSVVSVAELTEQVLTYSHHDPPEKEGFFPAEWIRFCK